MNDKLLGDKILVSLLFINKSIASNTTFGDSRS